MENTDYLLNKIIVQVPSGKKYKNEYFITLDMAKELSMVELLIVTGLRTALRSMILWKIKPLFAFRKTPKRKEQADNVVDKV